MPPGNKSGQPGAAFPLFGEGEIRAQSTGIDIVTITAPSTMDADFLVCRQYVPEGSTRVDSEKFVVSSAGVLTKFGMYGTVTASSGGLTVGSSRSGELFKLAGTTAAAAFTLPTPSAGAVYTFFIETAPTTGAYSFTCGTSGSFILTGDSGADGVSISSVAGGPGAVGSWIQFIGLSATKYATHVGWPGSSAVGSTLSLATAWIAAAS